MKESFPDKFTDRETLTYEWEQHFDPQIRLPAETYLVRLTIFISWDSAITQNIPIY